MGKENVPILIKTFENFQDNISVNQLEVMEDLFKKMGSFKLDHSNIIFNGRLEEGLVLELYPKQMNKTISEETKEELLNKINQKIESSTNEEEIHYYKTLVTLIENLNYISPKEQLILKIVFDSMYDHNEELLASKDNETEYAIKRRKS